MRWMCIACVTASLLGCAEMEEDVAYPRVASSPPSAREPTPCAAEPSAGAPVVLADSYPIYEAREEATRPLPRPRQSLSLGYVGDEPLAGGVTRETYMPPPQPYGYGLTWQQYVHQRSWPVGRGAVDARPYAMYPPPPPAYLPPAR